MTRALAFTRSVALRRASSSLARTSSWRIASSGDAMRRAARAGGAPARPCGTRAERRSASSPVETTRPKSSPRSASTMTAAPVAGASSDSQRKNSLRLPLNPTSISDGTSFGKLPHPQVLLAAPAHELVRLEPAELVELAEEGFLERLCRRVVIGVRAAGRFRNDL